MTRKSKRQIENEVGELKEATGYSKTGTPAFLYRHDKTGELYDRDKNRVDADARSGVAFVMGWDAAPFVVEREKAEANGWEVVRSIEPAVEPNGYTDLVEVEEWHPEPWRDR